MSESFSVGAWVDVKAWGRGQVAKVIGPDEFLVIIDKSKGAAGVIQTRGSNMAPAKGESNGKGGKVKVNRRASAKHRS